MKSFPHFPWICNYIFNRYNSNCLSWRYPHFGIVMEIAFLVFWSGAHKKGKYFSKRLMEFWAFCSWDVRHPCTNTIKWFSCQTVHMGL